MSNFLEKYRHHLTNYDAVLAYSLLGVLGGVASGLVVLAFEQAIAELARLWGVRGNGEDFEALPQWAIFALPAAGATLLGIAFALLRPEDRETGVVHVISRMHYHYGALPFKNAVVQFVGGAFALATGQSGGREGPGVHLGGAINSQLGQHLGLPNNSLRILIACGTAGGIAAAFNTPLAGVIFAMEVIIAEYTVVGFIPVMLAAVAASAVSHWLSGGGALFSIPALELNSLLEIPYFILLGFCCGVAASIFIRISGFAARLSGWPVPLRFALAGTLTGVLALAVPQILGIGYDTLNLAMQGEMAIAALLVIAGAKLVATAISCGVGMPLGLIGPNLLIGACIGGALGTAGGLLYPHLASDPSVYVIIGMGAAMGAVLNAPLAAILAIVELTHNVSISMPAMLAIVAATLTNTGLFHQRSAHQTVLRQLERRVPDDPINQLLHRTDVNSSMDTRVVRVPTRLQPGDLEPLLEFKPTWCLVEREGSDLYLVRGADLLDWLASREEKPADDIETPGERAADAEPEAGDATDNEDGLVDLTEADIRRWTLAPVPMQATLRQAMDTMRTHTVETVVVVERSRKTGKRILHGVVTRESIEKFTLERL